jgi:redox-sensitive bicupin YhaK (pirin superfamily)
MVTEDLPPGPVSGEMVRHGTGVNSNRAFPTGAYPASIDPFVLFERFYIDADTGFPMHPHRGFEIVSYMLDGGMDHNDSLGVSQTASEGDVMRITTGRGIRHSEFPAGGRACSGLQLWVNLSRADKDVEPEYEDASAEELPTETRDGATVTTVVGDGSPIGLRTAMKYLDVHVEESWVWSLPSGWGGFLYGVSGSGTIEGDRFGVGDVRAVTEARTVDIETDDELRVVAVSGRPHDEPIRQRGPYVL